MPTQLGTKIKSLRGEKGFSLERLAQMADTSKSYLWELENRDAANPTMDKLAKIADVLGVTTEFLLDREENEPSDAADKAFFRKYQKLPPKTKQKIRDILKVIQSDDKEDK